MLDICWTMFFSVAARAWDVLTPGLEHLQAHTLRTSRPIHLERTLITSPLQKKYVIPKYVLRVCLIIILHHPTEEIWKDKYTWPQWDDKIWRDDCHWLSFCSQTGSFSYMFRTMFTRKAKRLKYLKSNPGWNLLFSFNLQSRDDWELFGS